MLKFSRPVIGFAVIAGTITLAGCTQAEPEPPRTQDVTLYFYSQSDLRNATFDDPVAVTRTVSGTGAVAMDAALTLLFAGPTKAEKLEGALTSDDLQSLAPLYLGVWKEGTTVVVNFDTEALTVLNSAAARQFMAKEPMRQTLLQFEGIEDVEYAINGEIFTEWDA